MEKYKIIKGFRRGTGFIVEEENQANETAQIELLYRDIKIQMEELQELRPYKAAVEELETWINKHGDISLGMVRLIIHKHIQR